MANKKFNRNYFLANDLFLGFLADVKLVVICNKNKTASLFNDTHGTLCLCLIYVLYATQILIVNDELFWKYEITMRKSRIFFVFFPYVVFCWPLNLN